MASCSSSSNVPNVTEVREMLFKIQKNLECPICLELLSDPYTTQCCHPFCRMCIYKVISTSKVAKCPLCKITITKRSLNENTRLGEIVEAVKELEQAIISDAGIQKTPPRVIDHTHEATGTPGMIIHSLLHPSPVKPHPSEGDKGSRRAHSSRCSGDNEPTGRPLSSHASSFHKDNMAGPSKSPPSKARPVIRRKRRVRFRSSRSSKKGKEGVCSSKQYEQELLAALEEGPLREATQAVNGGAEEGCGGKVGVVTDMSCDLHVSQHQPAVPDGAVHTSEGVRTTSETSSDEEDAGHTCSVHTSRGTEGVFEDLASSHDVHVSRHCSIPLAGISSISEIVKTTTEPSSGGDVLPTHFVDRSSGTQVTMAIAETPYLGVMGESPLVVKETPFVRRCEEDIASQLRETDGNGGVSEQPVTGKAQDSDVNHLCNLSQDTTHPGQDTTVDPDDVILARETQLLSPPPGSLDPLIIAPTQLAVVEDTQLHTAHNSQPPTHHSSQPPTPHSSQPPTRHSSQPALISPLNQTNSSHPPNISRIQSSVISPVLGQVAMGTGAAVDSPVIPLQRCCRVAATGHSEPKTPCEANGSPCGSLGPPPTPHLVSPTQPSPLRESLRLPGLTLTKPHPSSAESDKVRRTTSPTIPVSVSPASSSGSVSPDYMPTPHDTILLSYCTPTPRGSQLSPNHTPTPHHTLLCSEDMPTSRGAHTSPDHKHTLLSSDHTPTPHGTLISPDHTPTAHGTLLSSDDTPTPHSTLLSPDHTPTPHCTLVSPEAELSTQELEVLRRQMKEKQREVLALEALLDQDSGGAAGDLSAPQTNNTESGDPLTSGSSSSNHSNPQTNTSDHSDPSTCGSSSKRTSSETANTSQLNGFTVPANPNVIPPPCLDKPFLHSQRASLPAPGNRPPSSNRSSSSQSQRNRSPVDSPKVIFETQFTAQTLSEDVGSGVIVQSVPSQPKKRERAPSQSGVGVDHEPSPKRTRSLNTTPSPQTNPPPEVGDPVNGRIELNSDDCEVCSLPSPNAPLPDDHPFMSISTVKPHWDEPSFKLVGGVRDLPSPPCVTDRHSNAVQPAHGLNQPSTTSTVTVPSRNSPDPSVSPIRGVSTRQEVTAVVTVPQFTTPKQCGGKVVQTPALTGGFPSPGGETRQTLSLVGSGLSKAQLRQAQKFARNHGGRLASVFNCHTTHVIMSCDTAGLCPRTIKYLQGVLSGVWVMSYQWVEESLSAERLLSEESYEVKGDNTLPDHSLCVPTKARLSRASQASGLFSPRRFYLHCEPAGISRDQLSQLLCLGGGEVVERVSGDEVIVCDCAVCGTDTSSVCTVVSSSWVLDSISRYKLLPMH